MKIISVIALISISCLLASCTTLLGDDDAGKPPTVDFKHSENWLS